MSAALARRGLAGLQTVYAPEASGKRSGRTEAGTWHGAEVLDRLLIAVFDAPSRAIVERDLGEVRRRIGTEPGSP